MNDSITQINTLITQGKKLVKNRPTSNGCIDLSNKKQLQEQAECHKWFVKSIDFLETNFGKNSKEFKLFVSFHKIRQWTNLLGTSSGEISFIKDNMLQQITHLEAIKEIIENKKLNPNNKKELNIFLKKRCWYKPFFWRFKKNVKLGFCPICNKPRTDRDGNIPGAAYVGGICYKCSEKLSNYNKKLIKIKKLISLGTLKKILMNPWVYTTCTAITAGIIIYILTK